MGDPEWQEAKKKSEVDGTSRCQDRIGADEGHGLFTGSQNLPPQVTVFSSCHLHRSPGKAGGPECPGSATTTVTLFKKHGIPASGTGAPEGRRGEEYAESTCSRTRAWTRQGFLRRLPSRPRLGRRAQGLRGQGRRIVDRERRREVRIHEGPPTTRPCGSAPSLSRRAAGSAAR